MHDVHLRLLHDIDRGPVPVLPELGPPPTDDPMLKLEGGSTPRPRRRRHRLAVAPQQEG